MKYLLIALLLLAGPAFAAQRLPLVINASGFTGQIQSGDELLTPATTAATAGLNLPHGTAPSAPINGDLWTTTGGLYVQINGNTIGPLGTGGGGGGVTSFNTRVGVVTLLGSDVTGVNGVLQSGSVTSPHCAAWSAAHTVVDSGGVCGSTTNQSIRALAFTFSGAGSALTTGATALNLVVPYACTITGWYLMADQSGSITLGISKAAFASYPPSSSIVASAPPTITSTDHASSATLTGWTTAVSANDVLRASISSTSTITQATLVLSCAAS